VDQQEMLNFLADIYENQMPFDRLLGVKVDCLSMSEVKVRIDMREDLVGNFARGILHGGVISSILDLTGGLIASVELLRDLNDRNIDEIRKRIFRVGTIDLRVDYLRGGTGEYFVASGAALRKGNKVTVIRTELVNHRNSIIAAGTGTYLIG
jgi:uncharacterized protein (TIGR00369 family)